MLDKLISHLELYKKLLIMCLDTLVEMLHAKFVFFSFVALAIGTIGIWVPVGFNLDLSSNNKVEQNNYKATVVAQDMNRNESESTSIETSFLLEIDEKIDNKNDVKIENFSIFMYVIGILGILAAEHFIRKKNCESEEEEAILTFSMLIWFIALVLSFWALKEPKSATWQLWVSFWFTTSLWLSHTVKKADFNGGIEKSKAKLGGQDVKDSSGFGGSGIK